MISPLHVHLNISAGFYAQHSRVPKVVEISGGGGNGVLVSTSLCLSEDGLVRYVWLQPFTICREEYRIGDTL